MKALLSAFALIGSSFLSFGESQQFTFALPELEGRISLGVFDTANKLVRTLAVQAQHSDFTVGLNGLTTSWDGKDDTGTPLPAGKYLVRGFVVGKELKSDGEAYHFNDWVDSEETALFQPRQVIGAQGEAIVLRGLQGIPPLPALFRYTESDGLKSAADQEEGASSGGVTWRDRIYSVSAAGPMKVSLSDGTIVPASETSAPADIRLLDANGDALIVSDGRSVWLDRGKKFEQVPMADDLEVSSLSAGVGQTFWIQARLSVTGVRGPAFVRQYAFGGEILRELQQDGDPEGSIFADKTRERIFLSRSLRDPQGSVIRGLQPVAGAEAAAGDQRTVDWEIFLDKKAEACPGFGFAGDKLVADAGSVAQDDGLKVVMAASSLTSRLQSVAVRASVVNGEVWLQTADGLRLSVLGRLPGGDRCVVRAEGGGAMRVFVGNGSVVAEYLVTGLKHMAEIDAGEIELP